MVPMELWHAVTLGIIEGITEFLPISSTGHLILASRLLGLPTTAALSTFEIVIQLGAILAVIVLYGRTLLHSRAVLLRVMVGFLPTAVFGFLLHGIVKRYFLVSPTLVLWSLVLGAVAMLLLEAFHREEHASVETMEQMTLRQAFLIGLCQSVALIPGVSRSAATILGGLLLGMRRKAIVDFSFVLAVPTMLAASGLDLFTSSSALSSRDFLSIGIGFFVSFLVAILAIRWLLTYVQHHSFALFAWERIVVAALFLLFSSLLMVP